jgi:hypothetical protein
VESIEVLGKILNNALGSYNETNAAMNLVYHSTSLLRATTFESLKDVGKK